MAVLESYYKDKEKDKVMRHYIQRGEYDIYIQDEIGSSQVVDWSNIPLGARMIVSIKMKQNNHFGYECPRCTCITYDDDIDVINGWID
ncbi:hypothetical protein H0H92_008808, partial [Tricholoma furcatifolium]